LTVSNGDVTSKSFFICIRRINITIPKHRIRCS
jgi:hypothetical protein